MEWQLHVGRTVAVFNKQRRHADEKANLPAISHHWWEQWNTWVTLLDDIRQKNIAAVLRVYGCAYRLDLEYFDHIQSTWIDWQHEAYNLWKYSGNGQTRALAVQTRLLFSPTWPGNKVVLPEKKKNRCKWQLVLGYMVFHVEGLTKVSVPIAYFWVCDFPSSFMQWASSLLNTIPCLCCALSKQTLWTPVNFNKLVFENAYFQVPATDSTSPVVSVSVRLSSLLLLLYCYICSLASCCYPSADDSIIVHAPIVYITYITVTCIILQHTMV